MRSLQQVERQQCQRSGRRSSGTEALPVLPVVDVVAAARRPHASVTAQVQPILMEHAAPAATPRATAAISICIGSTRSARAASSSMQAKFLAAVIGQIHFREPLLSPLLIKAVSTHCDKMSRSASRTCQAPAFHTLQEWVKLTIATNPHLHALRRRSPKRPPRLASRRARRSPPRSDLTPASPRRPRPASRFATHDARLAACSSERSADAADGKRRRCRGPGCVQSREPSRIGAEAAPDPTRLFA